MGDTLGDLLERLYEEVNSLNRLTERLANCGVVVQVDQFIPPGVMVCGGDHYPIRVRTLYEGPKKGRN